MFAVESGQLACQCAMDIPLGTLDETARHTSTLAMVRKLVGMETTFVSLTETMQNFEGTMLCPTQLEGGLEAMMHRLTATNVLLDYRVRLVVALNLLGMTYFDPKGLISRHLSLTHFQTTSPCKRSNSACCVSTFAHPSLCSPRWMRHDGCAAAQVEPTARPTND